MKDSRKPLADPLIVFREEFEDSGLLFNPDTGEMYGLNPVGMEIWKLLDGRHTLSDIAQHLQNTFEDVAEEMPDHVQFFIDALVLKGFVQS